MSHCSHTLVHKKDRKHFIIHKCVNPKCPYYLHNLKKVDKEHLKEIPKDFKFIADGYNAYPLVAQQFYRESKGKINFDITQVIGLTNDDEVSKEFRPFKQMIERLNRTYKASYRTTNGFHNIDGANYDLALWVAYYNFLRPHKHNKYKVLNKVDELSNANNMPGKWQLLIYLGHQTILNLQKAEGTNCS